MSERMATNLSREGAGFFVERGVVGPPLANAVARSAVGIAFKHWNVMFNDRTVEEFEALGLGDATSLSGQPGGRVMAKLDGRAPLWPLHFSGPSMQNWVELCSLAPALSMVAGMKYGRGGYNALIGPTLLRSFGDCPAQRPHVDMCQPRLFNELKPNLSYLVALQDGTWVVVFPHSDRSLPDENGGSFRKRIEPHTVVLNCGDIIIFRQDLVHHGAASIGVNHRVHWYADGAAPSDKSGTFHINVNVSM